jgi:hypothetical protein
MLCPGEIAIMEAAIPVLSVGLLMALVALVKELRLSVAAWQAPRQRHRALQEVLEVLLATAAGPVPESTRR